MLNSKFLLFVELLLCVAAAWFVFSVQGFLPRLYSMPIPEEKQQYNSPFYVTGSSYVSKIIVNYRKDTVEPKVLDALDVFKSNNIDASRGYYDRENDMFYIGNHSSIYECDREKGKLTKISDTSNTHYLVNTNETARPVVYNGIYFKLPSLASLPQLAAGKNFSYDPSDASVMLPHTLYRYDFFRDEKNNMTNTRRYNFERMTELLNKNETENISLEELTFLLWITRNRLLLGWYPETKTAVFAHYDEEEKKRYITRYTVGDDEPESFHLTLSNDTYFSRYDEDQLFAWDKSTNEIYLYNYITGERQDLVQAPELTVCRYWIRDDKNLLIAGFTSDEKIWTFWEKNGVQSGAEPGINASSYDLTICPNGLFLSYYANDSYGGRSFSVQMSS